MKRSRAGLIWCPLFVLALMTAGCGDDGSGTRQAASTGENDGKVFSNEGDDRGGVDGRGGACYQVCAIQGSDQPVIVPEPGPPDTNCSEDDPACNSQYRAEGDRPAPQDEQVMVCKVFCAPAPNCNLVCSPSSGAPACYFDCPQPQCDPLCDQNCIEDIVRQGVSDEEAVHKCCQNPSCLLQPLPPDCPTECDESCIDQLLQQGVDKDEAFRKCCQTNNCQPPPGQPPDCPTVCDESCIDQLLQQGVDKDEAYRSCCKMDPACDPQLWQ